jgi:hypothetical protein
MEKHMPVISSAVFPEYLLTQLQQSADAAARRLKSFIYLHRNSGWYVNAREIMPSVRISPLADQGVNVFLTVRTGCHRAGYVFHRLSVSFRRELQVVETHTFMPADRYSTSTPALSFLCTELNG